MKDKQRTFTFQISPEVRATLDSIAASKEWTTGHLVNSILTEYVASLGKPARVKKAAKPADAKSHISIDLDDIKRRMSQGESKKTIAASLGVSPALLTRRLGDWQPNLSDILRFQGKIPAPKPAEPAPLDEPTF